MAMMAWRAGWIRKTRVYIEVRMSTLSVVKIDLETTMVSSVLNAI
jgi:hypothetical protein